MVLAAFLAHRYHEPLLLCLDAASYTVLAVAVACASTNFTSATVTYLAICVTINAPRHIAARRAACNRDATSEGQLRRLPASLAAEESRPEKQTLWPWLPVVALCGAAATSQPLLALLAAESHFIVSRVHGDCRGGKPAPTLFVLILHATAASSGIDPVAALSIHRLLICCTYFLTGFRKLYCTGLKWCDGKNLQLMLGIQGLYHDRDASGWNFVLSRHWRLCCVGSVAVVALQLALPLVVAVDSALLRALGFAAAMSFHASNHILWRINFFVAWCPALVALLVPGPQVNALDGPRRRSMALDGARWPLTLDGL